MRTFIQESRKFNWHYNRWLLLLLMISVSFNLRPYLKHSESPKVDKFPKDTHLDHLSVKYKCVDYNPNPIGDTSITISLTTIPPRFGYLKDLVQYKSNDTQVVVNVPKRYKYFQKTPVPAIDGLVINAVDVDYGPGTKLLGLCNMLDEVNNIIIYIDDDIQYSIEMFRIISRSLSPGCVIGGHGGFYTGIGDPNLSFLGYNYFKERFNYQSCYIEAEVLMGFGGVALYKNDLKRICNCPILHDYIHKSDCYFIDDDWLGQVYSRCGLKKFSNPELILSREVSRSENDGWSNRNMYYEARKKCLKTDLSNYDAPKLLIRTALIEGQESLHSLSEYKGIKRIVRENHYNFINVFGHDYKLYVDTKLEKSHWVKIEILRDFLETCQSTDILFYTDYDFLFTNNYLPKLSGSIMMAKGCSYDDNMVMVGTFVAKCDKSLMSFTHQWEKVAKECSSLSIKNDDQIAFNLIKYDLAYKLQIEDFYRYDICERKPSLIGYHFPGGNKADRMLQFKSQIINELI